MRVCSIISVLFFSMVLFSCNDDKNENIDIYGKWQIDNLMSLESIAYPKNNGFSPWIEFKENGSFEIKLDANTGNGSFVLSGDDSIHFSMVAVTKICCDSEFSKKFLLMLPQVTGFSFEGNMLKLNVPSWGWFELKRI
ncbi:META domain-containing protein [Maribellus sp. YY47]|uniref:META domain-containing protein n=1 Tax=Maribellus sp. YY47 TaxID=2929486 RepID=UPI0020018D1E|nr:META domain-containing protein [Maribellus sp. YY47]MCK3685492.1 META domain-containing protein [Maribellus sp. YY47]